MLISSFDYLEYFRKNIPEEGFMKTTFPEFLHSDEVCTIYIWKSVLLDCEIIVSHFL